MEIIEKQVEKVKEIPTDGYYGYGRRDINGKANAGLTLGIIGTALGAWALFGNRRSGSILGGTGLGSGSGMDANIAIASCGLSTSSANGVNAPTSFQAWEKECEDTLALQAAIYNQALNYQNNRFADRQTLNSELFSLWKGQIDADFGLYKSTRDGFDVLSAKQNQDAFNLYKSQRDAEISPMTDEQKTRMLQDEDYVDTYTKIQDMVQAEILDLVKGRIEATPEGKELLQRQLKIVKKLKGKIIQETNREMEMFRKFREFSKTHPEVTYEEFIKASM
jgi:hypothetical protein